MRPASLAFTAALVAATFIAGSDTGAQLRVQPLPTSGAAALELQLRKLDTIGTLMMATAHPDDENNALLTWVSQGLGMRAALVTATRGDGGQNEIGPELFDALAVLRTEELRAAHRFDGAEQYFTRAVDFGYSFSIEESLEKWGKDEILGDFVRVIRTLRPDVMVGFVWDGRGGGQHHQASSRLSAEAFRAAADPSRFPEQLREGLRPWQPKKFYYTAGFGGPAANAADTRKLLDVDCTLYDRALGRTYSEIGLEARSMHKCQGTRQLLMLPGDRSAIRYRLHDTVLEDGIDRTETSMFDGLDLSFRALPALAGPQPPRALSDAVGTIAGLVDTAHMALAARGPLAAAAPLADGLRAARSLRAAIAGMDVSDAARYEIEFRLDQKLKQFETALLLAHGVEFDVVANDGVVHPGQQVGLQIRATAREDAEVRVKMAHPSGFDQQEGGCEPGSVQSSSRFECEIKAGIPADARVTTPYFTRRADAARYDFEPDAPFGLPESPTPFRVAVDFMLSGVDVTVERPVQFRYENVLAGEKRMELLVVPKLGVSLSPDVAVVPIPSGSGRPAARPAANRAVTRELRVTVTNHTREAASGEVTLDVPTGWRVAPPSIPVSLAREDESTTVRFTLTPPANLAEGEVAVTAEAKLGSESFETGADIIEYPHTMRRQVMREARTRVKALDVKIAPNLTVGYIVGVGDEVPAALEQVGAKVELIDADTLAWGNLSRFDAIVTGVRAYERRADLRANNARLLDYAKRGGTVLVQYNKFEFNDAQYGPFPAKVSATRVTDENGPVRVLVPDHPAFTWPNRITSRAWDGWVQERGLYFLGERDPAYVDLVEVEESFEYNKGVKRGALVEARVGQGRWIYIGLGLWRQLPAGTDGAYALLANLVSLGKSGPTKPTEPNSGP